MSTVLVSQLSLIMSPNKGLTSDRKDNMTFFFWAFAICKSQYCGADYKSHMLSSVLYIVNIVLVLNSKSEIIRENHNEKESCFSVMFIAIGGSAYNLQTYVDSLLPCFPSRRCFSGLLGRRLPN